MRISAHVGPPNAAQTDLIQIFLGTASFGIQMESLAMPRLCLELFIFKLWQETGANRDSNLADCLFVDFVFKSVALCMAIPKSFAVNALQNAKRAPAQRCSHMRARVCWHYNFGCPIFDIKELL